VGFSFAICTDAECLNRAVPRRGASNLEEKLRILQTGCEAHRRSRFS